MKVSDTMKNVIQDKRDYYARMMNTCDKVLQGQSLKDACNEEGITVATFRNRVYKQESKPTLYSQSEVVSALESMMSPEERLVADVFQFFSPKSSISPALINYPDDFEETIQNLISEMDERTQRCIQSYYFEDRTYASIGKEFNLSLESIRLTIHKAWRRLRRGDRVLRIIYGDKVFFEIKDALESKSEVYNMMQSLMKYATEIDNPISLYDTMLEWIVSAKKSYQRRQIEQEDITESIDTLGLSTRAFNALIRRRITKVSQLLNMTDAELLSVKNLGIGTLEEIDEVLTSLGYNRIHTRE